MNTFVSRSLKGVSSLCLAGLLVTAISAERAPAAAFQSFDSRGANLVSSGDDLMKLEQGKGKLIRLSRPAAEVFIANPEVADVQVKSDRLVYIFGRGRGETTFYAIDENDQTIYSTEVSVTQNLGSLKTAVARLMPNRDIDVSAIGGLIVLQGQVSSPDEAATIERLARALGDSEEILNRIDILQPTQVNLRVRFAEVSRSIMKELGFRFESGFANGTAAFGAFRGADLYTDVFDDNLGGFVRQVSPSETATTLFGALTTGDFDLNGAIDALNNEGFVTVLAEPNLTALSGETARFLAGGEFPIPIPSRDGLGIEFREFGVRLDFTPTVLNSGSISMRVRPEVSDLSTAGAIQIASINIPSIVTRRAETTVELGSGQSFAIAGLLQNDITQAADKFPGLGDLPIIGALFRSDRFERDETELMIVITPYVVQPVSDRQLALPTDGYIAPNDMDRFLKGRRWQPRNTARAKEVVPVSGPALTGRAGFRLD